MSNIIELEGISKAYGENIIFDGFNLCIEKGDYIAITGKSGAGKSTLLNMLGLLEKPDSGNITICGFKNPEIGSKSAVNLLRYKIGYLFQNYGLVETDTVEQNIRISSKFKKWSAIEEKKKISEILEIVDLAGTEKKMIYQMSGGEQQRVAIAKLMIKSPEIVLADEPTGSLDPENRDIVMKLIDDIHKSGKTIVVVTHDEKVRTCARKNLEL